VLRICRVGELCKKEKRSCGGVGAEFFFPCVCAIKVTGVHEHTYGGEGGVFRKFSDLSYDWK